MGAGMGGVVDPRRILSSRAVAQVPSSWLPGARSQQPQGESGLRLARSRRRFA